MILKELLEKINSKGAKKLRPEEWERYLDEILPHKLAQEEILQKIFGLTDREMEKLYSEGFVQYRKGDYKEAINTFTLCTILNPTLYKYWMALASAQQMGKELHKALHGYAVAAFLESKTPLPHFHAYECLQALGQKEEAKKALLEAIKLAKTNPCYTSLCEKMEDLNLEN